MWVSNVHQPEIVRIVCGFGPFAPTSLQTVPLGGGKGMDMKLGFIGLGNMASAMIGGILKEGIARPEEIIGSAKTRETAAKRAAEFGIETCTDNKRIAERSDVLVLAVKPQFFCEVAAQIRDSIKKDALVISIMAGKTMGYIEEHLGVCGGGKQIKLVRCMPNTPALVLAGCSGYCMNGQVAGEDAELAKRLLGSFGKAIEVPEPMIDAVGGVAGSSPAFVFLFIEALADGAVAEGMPRAQAVEFAAQAVYGSAKLLLLSGRHPGELKDMVCSPGGSTIQGVRALERGGMRSAVMEAVIACVERSKKL